MRVEVNGKPLHLGDTITYRAAIPALGTHAPTQYAHDGPFEGVIVHIGNYSVQVRKDGSTANPLYVLLLCDILKVEEDHHDHI